MGKRTTTRHKEDNTFRFKTFEDKLRQISVNVNLAIRDGRGENPEESETYFSQEIEKWVDLNRTESFASLLCDIGTSSRTLSQILLQKDRLAKVLLEHLESVDNMVSFEPAFGLVIALARDLGEEFYPHFESFFQTIIKIVKESKNTDIIEAGFKCYAYLSKYLRRQIVKDIHHHMKSFSCFLDPKLKTYVIIFACEAFSIVAGKFARDYPEKFLNLMFGIFLRKHPEHAVGVSTLLFAIFKGIGNTLKLEGPGMHFKDCLKFLNTMNSDDETLIWTDVLCQLTHRLLNHANPSNSEILIHLVENTILEKMEDSQSISNLLKVYGNMVEFNNSGKLTDVPSCAKVLSRIAETDCERNMDILIQAVVAIINSKCSTHDTEVLNSLQETICKLLKIVPYNKLEELDTCLRGFRAYFRMFLEPVIGAYNRVEKPSHIVECPDIAVYCISEAILHQGGLYQGSDSEDHYLTGSVAPMYLYQNQRRIITTLNASSLKGTLWNCCALMKEAETDLLRSIASKNLNYYVRLLLVFSRLNSKNCDSCLQTCLRLMKKFLQLEKIDDSTLAVTNLILQVFITQLSLNSTFYEEVPVNNLLDHLMPVINGACYKESFSLWGLKNLDILLHFIKNSKCEKHLETVKQLFQTEWEILTGNLQSGFRVVRALTVSILRNIMDIVDNPVDKTVEMLDKFLQLEDMGLTNPKFSSLAKSILTECKVIIGSETYDVDLKQLCLKYTIGLMYTNYSLIWSPCAEVIRHASKHIDLSKYWGVFGPHFRRNQGFFDKDQEQIRVNLLPNIDDNSTNLLDLITIETFGLPKEAAGYTGPEEQLDVVQYRINLWLSLKGQPLTRKEFEDVKPLVDSIIEDPSEINTEESGSKRERAKMLIPLLQFLEACDLVNVNHEMWESALKFLTYSHEVQKAAWKFLFAKRKNKLKSYKEDIDEIINNDSIDPVHKFRLDAVDTSLNKQYENETTDRRSLIMELLIRILIGKERAWKGEKRLQVLRFLAGCSESDARKYLDLTVGPPQEVKQLPPKIIEIKINKMTSALRIWRYKFPNILDQIVHGACDLVCAVNSSIKPLSRKSLDPSEHIPEDVFEEQKKAALKAGRICIVAFFTSLPRLDMKEETLNRIFEVFIWPSLCDLTTTSVGSVSWILKLFLVWSTHERYHPLFTKSKNGDVQQTPMWKLFDLLDSKSPVFEVKKYILGIILNLTNPPEIAEELDDPSEEILNCSNSPLKISDTYKFETSESTGINIVLLRKEVILNLFQDPQTFKKFTVHTGGGNCLSLISLLAGFATGGIANEKLCSVIIDTFPMCKNNEENFYNSIVAVGKLLSNVENETKLLMKLSSSFAWISGRRLRSALVSTLECKSGSPIYEVISGLNAWTDMAADTPDFSKRQESFDQAAKLIKEERFNVLSHALIFYTCMYNISHEEDIGMKNAAKTLLMTMASSLKTKAIVDPTTKVDIHRLVESVIIPKFRGGIHMKDEKRFEDILTAFHAFISECGGIHGTFKELSKVLSSDIAEGLCDIQIHLRTRAMNKLCKKLQDNLESMSGAVLQAYILPIATHNLFNEERQAKNFNELIDSSIEVLKTVMSAISYDQYFTYLNKLLDDPKKKTKLAKQFERVLIAIMDAFHFDLSLASADSSSTVAAKNASDPQKLQDKENQEEPTNEGEMEMNQEKEEFNIPTETHQIITLIPKAAAIKCIGILKSSIIPKLRKFLNFEETATHKLSRSKKTVDDDVILKIPCTVALVKLLKKIPRAEGQNGIRSIIPSITAGLRNELVSIRNTLRKTLLSVIKELGTSHLKVVVGYLKSSLQRGYQKHVLNYTVAYLLRCLENDLKANPSHVPVKEVVSLCEEELYGVMQEEKELAAIKQKTREASKSNACPILKVCSKCVSTMEQLNTLIAPAIRHITEKKSLKIAKASRQWLTSVGEGVSDNNAVNYHELLGWLVEVIKKDNAPIDNSTDGSDGEPLNKKRKLLESPKDSQLIPLARKKTVSESKLGSQSLLTEFAFACLYNGLNKNGRLREQLTGNDSLILLDSFVTHLADGIKAPSKQVNVVSLRCITLLFEFELTSFKKPEIIDRLQRHGFTAMNNHCYRNTTDSETTNATFKFLSAFFLRFPDFKVVLQDFELMLKCIQSYLTDGNCSSSALTLLRGVLQNKYRCSILPDLMQEVFKQCITSFYQHINEGCRQAYITYLNNYLTNPKDLYMEVQIILRQLDYKHEKGRVTAAEILNSLLQSIPEDCFEEIKELVFLKLLATLDKDKFPAVREKIGEAIKSLFRLETRKSLVRILLKLLLMDKHIPELDTFFLIIGLLVDDPKVLSSDDLTIIIQRIKDVLDPASFEIMCSQNSRISQQIKDYIIFQALVALKKAALGRNVLGAKLWNSNSQLSEVMQEICKFLRDVYLQYEHEWVPLITVDIFAIALNKLALTDEIVKNEVAKTIGTSDTPCVFLQDIEDLKQILVKLWEAIKRSEREDFLAKGAFILIQLIPVSARLTDKEIFVNIISSIRASVNGEVVRNPGVTTIRTVALGCFRGVAKTCPKDAIEQVVEIMTRVAVRELTDSNVPSELKNESEKLITVLRDSIGNSEFNLVHAKVNDFFFKKRNLNRAKKKENVMLHPGLVRKRPKKTKSFIPMKKKRKVK